MFCFTAVPANAESDVCAGATVMLLPRTVVCFPFPGQPQLFPQTERIGTSNAQFTTGSHHKSSFRNYIGRLEHFDVIFHPQDRHQ